MSFMDYMFDLDHPNFEYDGPKAQDLSSSDEDNEISMAILDGLTKEDLQNLSKNVNDLMHERIYGKAPETKPEKYKERVESEPETGSPPRKIIWQ